MDIGDFLGSSRWEILKIIASQPSSPVEIAGDIGTSVAYVSQQIKLLEVANLLTKQRTGAVSKGKPRSLFSLSKELVYIASLVGKHPAKKSFTPKDHQRAILKIWMIENDELHYPLEKLYWELEEQLSKIKGLFVDVSKNRPKVIVVSESASVKQKVNSLAKKFKGTCDLVSVLDIKTEEGLIEILDFQEGKT